jgi:transposase
MPQNFIECDREQAFLMPPSLVDWLPADHLAWFVVQAVGELELDAFYASYRPDGHGRAAYEPAMMVSLVLYAYATGEYSSRGIERHCRQDIAYRVITANRAPDHATIARFIGRHEGSLADLFGQVLGLCAKAGLVSAGVVAVDGSKISANASREQNVDYDQIAREIIAQGRAIDEAEDEQYGDKRGDELPQELATEAGRREWLKREIAAERERTQKPGGEDRPSEQSDSQDAHDFDTALIVARTQGREGWLREAKRQLDQDRWADPGPVPRSRAERLRDAARRLEDDLDAERRGNAAYEHYKATGRMRDGRRFGAPPKPYVSPDTPQGTVNLTDPDCKLIKGHHGFMQGYNAQAVVTEQQIVLAAEITGVSPDFSHFEPMITATIRELHNAEVSDTPDIAVADAGYWNEQHMDQVTAEHGIRVLIPPDSSKRHGERPGWTGGRYTWMRTVLAGDLGKQLYAKRKKTIEPVFGHTKHNRKFDRFHRRGRAGVRAEWRLLMMTHNLTKLHAWELATG